MPMMDEDENTEAFAEAVSEAFPEELFDENRLAALKEAIRICVRKDMEGGYEEEEKKPGTLAWVFGGKPKKD